MRGGARGSAGRDSIAIRRTLVVVQVALSVALLFSSLLFTRTLANVLRVDPGFRVDGLFVARLNFSDLNGTDGGRDALRRLTIERIRAIPGIEAAATAAVVPFGDSSGGNDAWPEKDPAHQFNSRINIVGSMIATRQARQPWRSSTKRSRQTLVAWPPLSAGDSPGSERPESRRKHTRSWVLSEIRRIGY
jgi:hypothetical protein